MTLKHAADRALENWPAKIVCLTLSLLLFLFYRMSTLEQRFFSVPLAIETNGDLVPASPYPRMVKITLRGETNSIVPILESDVVAYVDLARYTKEGEYRAPIRTRLKGTALDVDPLEVSVDPIEITLRVEHRQEKRVSVTPSFKGYPEAGYEFAGFVLSPETVEVSGPRSAIEKLGDLVTEPIELSGRNEGFSGSAPIVNRSPLVSISGDGKVQYQVSIAQTTLIKTFENVPFYLENLSPAFEVQTDVVSGTLQLKGSQAGLSSFVLPENALTVLCEGVMAPGVYNLPVQAIVPAPYEIVSSSPIAIQLTVKRRAP